MVGCRFLATSKLSLLLLKLNLTSNIWNEIENNP